MRTRKEKPIFRGLTIAATGSLGGSAQWTDTNIARWVGLRMGRFVRVGAGACSASTSAGAASAGGGGGEKGGGEKVGGVVTAELGEEVTHVVCSAEEFRRGGRVVKTALRLKTCELVTLDWLEDSLMRGRKLPEEPYSHLRALRKERERERRRQGILKGLELAVRQVNPNLYHIYCDELFWYDVTLTRGDERYVLTLFESNNASPHLYWFVAKFYRAKGATPHIYRPSHAPAVFAQEYDLFTYLFQIKTGVPWEQRLVRPPPVDQGLFAYQPPTGGKPVGWAPVEYRPAEGEAVGSGAGVADASGTTSITGAGKTTGTDAGATTSTTTAPAADANGDQTASDDAAMQVEDANDGGKATDANGMGPENAQDRNGVSIVEVGLATDAQGGEGGYGCQVEAAANGQGGKRVISSIVAPVA